MQQNTTAKNFFRRGITYHAQGEIDKAISDYNQAIKLDPTNEAVYNNRGIAHYAQGEIDKAISDYSQAIKLNPTDGAVYNNRGVAYETQGKLVEAISDFIQAIMLKLNYALAYESLERVFLNIKDSDLDRLDKRKIFSAIKLFSNEKQIVLLEQSIDPDTVLGKRFWKQEGVSACSLERGTLKEICDHLKKLNPNWEKPKSTSIFNGHTVLFGYRSPKTKLPEINPVFDHAIFKL